MLRLRTTTTLSLLALLVGAAGTQWLCSFTDDWRGPPPRPAAMVAKAHRPLHVRRHAHAAPRVVGALPDTVATHAAAPEPASLLPLSTPPDPAPYVQLRGHLDGYVVLAVRTDGGGRVTSARIAQSSGDAVLDAHALATVQRWRFAVPAGHEGVQGELPMRFDSTAPPTPP